MRDEFSVCVFHALGSISIVRKGSFRGKSISPGNDDDLISEYNQGSGL